MKYNSFRRFYTIQATAFDVLLTLEALTYLFHYYYNQFFLPVAMLCLLFFYFFWGKGL